jgi:hypothetical protein
MPTGAVFDAAGSYSTSFWIAEGAILLVALCFFFLPPYRFPAQLAAYSQPAAEDAPPEAMPQSR